MHWVQQCVCSVKYSVVINGGFEGGFPGKRGLRQGNANCLLLFSSSEYWMAVLTITQSVVPSNCVTLLLRTIFSFYVECLRILLSLLKICCMIFIPFLGFSKMFRRVQFSLEVWMIFLKFQMLGILPFPEGCFPIKYLGVLLISKKLKAGDCAILKDKILHQI